MRCPFCDSERDRVVDSRECREGRSIRRRRECLECGRRFTSYEHIEEIPYMVIKRGGQREPFDRSKVLRGLLKAAEKRPVSPTQFEQILDAVEQRLQDAPSHELSSVKIGEIVMEHLRQIDKVAYVRFASVYLDFKSVQEFMDEINHLVRTS